MILLLITYCKLYCTYECSYPTDYWIYLEFLSKVKSSMVVFLSYQSKIRICTCTVYMTGEYWTMFLKSNNLNIFTKLYTAETFKGLPHPWASPSKSRLWNCTIQIFLGSEKKVISFSMKNKCTYEKIALCIWLCTVYTLHVIQYIWRSLQNHMKKKAFSANICMVILRRFF